MKDKNHIFNILIAFLLIFGFTFPLFAKENKDKPSDKVVNQKIKKLQIPFIANEGQTDEKVKFYASTFGGTVFVTKEGEIVYSMPDSTKTDLSSKKHPDIKQNIPVTQCILSHYAIQTVSLNQNCLCNNSMKEKDHLIKGVILKEEIVGGKVNNIKGKEKSITKVNYFRGNDKKNWKNNVSTYDVVDLGEVYKGIELKLKAYGNNVEKLFYVKPESNPEAIQLKLSGAQNLTVNENGELEAETESGTVKFTKPIAYQEIEGKRITVNVKYVVCDREPTNVKNPKNTGTDNGHASQAYGFTVTSYDTTKELVIDPLLASTELGNSPDDTVQAIALDTVGNIYVVGYTYSNNFPTTEGAYNENSYSEDYDADVFISKFDNNLTTLLASTLLGGVDNDRGYAIASDSKDNIYVGGRVESDDFPTTIDAYDSTINGDANGNADVFISKFDNNLTTLLASTFLGGSGRNEQCYSIALDDSDNVYVCGVTPEKDFPTTPEAYDTSSNGTNHVFISKFNNDLSTLLASTFLGESSGSSYGYALVINTIGDIYVTGGTSAKDFPTTSGAYDTSNNEPLDTYASDVFISKLDSSLSNLLASTYLGGSDYDVAYAITIEEKGNIYVAGLTGSSDFPTTSNAYDSKGNASFYPRDVFISKLNGDLSNLLASTYVSGVEDDYANSISIDTSGNVIIAGNTRSSDFPITIEAYDTSYYDNDGFISKFDNDLTNLLSSTFLSFDSSMNVSDAQSIIIDKNNDIYVAGQQCPVRELRKSVHVVL